MKPVNTFNTFLYGFSMFLFGVVFVSGCEKANNGPLDVTWTGRVLDEVNGNALPGIQVVLKEASFAGPGFSGAINFSDTLQSIITDAQGRFSFTYFDPDDSNWFAIQCDHPDYFPGEVHYRDNPQAQINLDMLLQPKSWLKIRVQDVPHQNVNATGILFANLNSKAMALGIGTDYISIQPSSGDTTFFAFKLGGVPTAFHYFDSDSMDMVKIEDVFPPFDTTEFRFTY